MSETRPSSHFLSPQAGYRNVFVRDLVLEAPIGVWGHEHGRRQKIRINLDLRVVAAETEVPTDSPAEALSKVVCYQQAIEQIESLVRAEHIRLVETLAERIAGTLLQDGRILSARIRVEKLEAVPNAASVGVEIERFQKVLPP